MTKKDRERYREPLLLMGRRIRGDMVPLRREALHTAGGEDSGNLSNAPMHLADLGTDYFEKAMSLSLLENKAELLQEITDALQRIDDGTFGTCENCRRPIAKARLDTLPFTRHCIDCAEVLQKNATLRGPG